MTDLVFVAMVESVEVSPIGIRGGFLDWIVRTRVESVVAGHFEGQSFAFRVHSPARSGLEVGKRCTVTATWTGDGYRVDEDQWHGCPHT